MDQIKEYKNTNILYDVFGYFLPGFFFICLIIIDYDLSKIIKFYVSHGYSLGSLKPGMIQYKLQYLFNFLTWNTQNDFKFTTLIILIFFCYLGGHIIAAVSSYLLEVKFNRAVLGFPSSNLLDTSKRSLILRLFWFYTSPFDDKMIKRFSKVFRKRFGFQPTSKDCFWLCFTDICKYSPVGLNRTIHFLNLYGFSRNIACCFFIYIAFRIIAFFVGSPISLISAVILIFYFFGDLIMTINYLKLFYRQCVELYYHFYSMHSKSNG